MERLFVSINSVTAIAFFSYVLLYVAISMVAVPALDTFETIDNFFLISSIATMGTVLLFLFCLIRQGDHYSSSLIHTLVLVLQLGVTLGCIYLYYNARMGTGIFASP